MAYKNGYRYIMNNCLLHEAIVKIVWDCKCKPSFHTSDQYPPGLKYCTGKELNCLQSKLSSMAIGKENQKVKSDESVKSHKIGDFERYKSSKVIFSGLEPSLQATDMPSSLEKKYMLLGTSVASFFMFIAM